MTRLADQRRTSGNGGLQQFDMDEAIDVRFGHYGNASELARMCGELSTLLPDESLLTLVICLADNEQSPDVKQLMDYADAASRLVITSVTGAAAWQLPLTTGDLRAEADRRSMKSIVVEHDVAHAVIGSMQFLKPGDAFVVLVPDDVPSQQVLGWLTQGARWRGSCEAPDDGYFHYLPW